MHSWYIILKYGGRGRMSKCRDLVRELDTFTHWYSMSLLKWCITLLTWGNVQNILLKSKDEFYSRMYNILPFLLKGVFLCMCA